MTAFSSMSQSFEIAESKSIYSGFVGEQIVAEIPIKNLTDRPLEIGIKRIEVVIGTSQTTYLCIGEDCEDSETDELTLAQNIQSGQTLTQLSSILEAGLVPGVSTVKYLIYNRNNPSETVEYEVNYTIKERADSKLLYSSSELDLKEIYPNPVVDFAILSYELKNKETEAKIVLHNVLGSIVNEYDLIPFENKLKIQTESLNPGVYFYTLYIDGDGITTHKIVIRK